MSIRNPTQQERVLDFMLNAGWKTLAEISEYMAARGKRIPETSVSARLRQFKTWQGGKYQMEARRPEQQGWQWRYRLTEPGETVEMVKCPGCHGTRVAPYWSHHGDCPHCKGKDEVALKGDDGG